MMTDAHRPIPITAGRPDAEVAPTPSGPAPAMSPAPRPTRSSQTPLIDIYEGPEGLILEADLPGATESSLIVQLEENVLYLRAQSSEGEQQVGQRIYQEFQPGDFARSFILSDEVDRSRISAEIRNGVLRVELPRSERSKTRRIVVKSP